MQGFTELDILEFFQTRQAACSIKDLQKAMNVQDETQLTSLHNSLSRMSDRQLMYICFHFRVDCMD